MTEDILKGKSAQEIIDIVSVEQEGKLNVEELKRRVYPNIFRKKKK